MSTLSAIVLTYNKSWIFREFAASLDRQSRRPDEIIVVDDASTDGMRRELAELPPSWTILALGKNGGQSRARNLGCRHAAGDYVIFLDADIVMSPDMLASLSGALDADPTAGVAYGHFERQGSRNDPVRSIPWNAEVLQHRNYISMVSLVRRSHLPEPPLDETLHRYEDWDLWIRMSLAGRSGVLVDRTLFTAHYRPEDLSGRGESLDWYRKVLAKHKFPLR